MKIEYAYSQILGKFVVATDLLRLHGLGIKEHMSKEAGASHNVYLLTRKAFAEVVEAYPHLQPMNDTCAETSAQATN